MASLLVSMTGRLIPLVFALTLSLFAAGCATGPLGSHGVDYVPAFDTPEDYGNG